MIANSRLAQIGAVVIAVGAHLGFGYYFQPDMEVKIENAQGAAQAALGASFADMTVGTITPNNADEMAEAVTPETVEAEPITQTTQPISATPAVTPTSITVTPIKQTAAIKPVEQPKPKPAPKKKPVVKKPVVKKAKLKPAKAAPIGNAKQNNIQGSSTGNSKSKAKKQGTSKAKGKQSGNAAASNYPGQVMRKVSRVRRPKLRAKGVATIAFHIGASGQLASISVAKTSGSAKLDQAALKVVRTAAPFPKPPSGARRSFSVKIRSR